MSITFQSWSKVAGLELGADVALEVGPGARDGVVEALGVGEDVCGHVAELLLHVRVAGVAGLERGRAHVEAAAPDEDLVLAVLAGGVGLVEALERAVVALVELPGLVDGQPAAVHLVEDDVEGVDGALEHRGVAHVEVEALLGEGAPAVCGLAAAGVGEVDVGPAGEEVELVPLALAVADEHEAHGVRAGGLGVCHGGSFRPG